MRTSARRAGVSIHAPTGGATETLCVGCVHDQFQFTRPRGARLSLAPKGRAADGVSIHAPTGGATSQRLWHASPLPCFNSRAHGGRDNSATARFCASAFQFTRPRGARPDDQRLYRRCLRFNSRAHGGRDRHRQGVRRGGHVSIHAPTGGATRGVPKRNISSLFQFTRPRGARPAPPPAGRDGSCFNSRAHGGRDRRRSRSGMRASVSIHAPTGGATQLLLPREHLLAVSIHAPTGGATKMEILSATHPNVSIHAPTGGATDVGGGEGRREEVSIHAPTGGATRLHGDADGKPAFQFTRPRGARPKAALDKATAELFQFTRPRGARQHGQHGQHILVCFNSRAHGGRDTFSSSWCRIASFQFTRPRGARRGGQPGRAR